jgi:hypothetical protein
MKKVIIGFSQGIILITSLLVAYRLGYCNACDEYIGASECKPTRKLRFFEF